MKKGFLTSRLFETLGGQSKKMADGARPIRDFQPPFGTVAKPCDGVADLEWAPWRIRNV
jgi:hypothetical protein